MAITKNLYIDQGANFQMSLTAFDSAGSVLSITSGSGYTATGKLAKSYLASSKISFVCSITGSTGQVSIALGATALSGIRPGVYVYDVEVQSPDGKVYRIVQGNVTIDPNVT